VPENCGKVETLNKSPTIDACVRCAGCYRIELNIISSNFTKEGGFYCSVSVHCTVLYPRSRDMMSVVVTTGSSDSNLHGIRITETSQNLKVIVSLGS
jgi:hypothetical protein